MYCQNCGSVLSEVARFCPSCAKTQSLSAPTLSSASAQRKKGPKFKVFWLVAGAILVTIIAGIISKSSSDKSTSTEQSSASSASLQPQIIRSNVPPPKFHIYKFRLDEPTSIVVPVNTTDEQLKSLLWFFREKVRSCQFKDIGLMQATAKQWGNKGYLSGILVVYRGEKCANEEYVSKGPCGYGEHDDAAYQWGIEADPNKDSGSISMNGNDTTVFDYKDGWQIAPEIQAQLDEQAKSEQAQRDVFAQQLQQRLTSMGYEINVLALVEGNDRGGELELDSEMFKDVATRVQFINSV
jgi:hypothetical protein